MKPVLLACLTLVAASAAQAHPGHLAEVAGHGHWLGAAALGAAIALGAWAALKGKRSDAAEQADPEAQADTPQDDALQDA